MANLRQIFLHRISVSLPLIFLLFGSAPSTAEGPTFSGVFYESDLMSSQKHTEWVFSSTIYDLVTGPAARISALLSVNENTRTSLRTLNSAYQNDPGIMQTGRFSDLAYAYSESNSAFWSYRLAGVSYAYYTLLGWFAAADNESSIWRQHKWKIVTTTAGAIPGAYIVYKTPGMCRKVFSKAAVPPQPGPPAQQAQAQAQAQPVTGFRAYVKTKFNAGLAAVTTVTASIMAKPWLAKALIATPFIGAAAGNVCKGVSDYALGSNDALNYYTDVIIGGDGSTYSDTWSNFAYHFSSVDPARYFNYYLDHRVIYSLMEGMLRYNQSLATFQFGSQSSDIEENLWAVSEADKLSTAKIHPLQDCIPPQTGELDAQQHQESFKKCAATNKSTVKEVIPTNDGCYKYTFFGQQITGSEKPLYLASVCSSPGHWAYIKLPHLGFARVTKDQIGSLIYNLTRFTGTTELTVQTPQ